MWLHASHHQFVFKAKACSDVHVALSSVHGSSDGMEVVIGGWSNSMSAIRPTKGGHLTEVTTLDILSCDQFRSFWITWSNTYGTYNVGTGEVVDQQIFMSYTEDSPRGNIHHIGLSTGYGFSGEWEFHETIGRCNAKLSGYLSCTVVLDPSKTEV